MSRAMKSRKLSLLLLLAAFPLSCSPRPRPQSAYDHAASFSNLKTFDWYADPAEDKGVGGAVVDTRWVDEHVKAAVTEELGKKGLRPAKGAAPDFFVDYHTRAAGISQRDKYGMYTWWSPYTYVGSETRKQATLALDVRDAEKKLIWRAWITATVGTSPEEIYRQVRKSVGELLSDFPPGMAAAR